MTFARIRLLIPYLIFLSSAAASAAGLSGTQDTVAFASPYVASPFYEDNERCFKCHGQKTFEYTNENLGRQVKELMFSERIVNREKFYNSNHRSFSCTDCHSEGYTSFPHPGELRMEEGFNCIDCHGGDEKFAKYHFEEIEAEYKNSVHFKLEEEGFTCWKCHGPHDYKISIRTSANLKETILYDNNICLNCHANFDHFQLLSEGEEVNILQKHEWLPNQASHFKNVRCIECHSEITDTILVSHLILPKTEAVKRCNECHSQNSLLLSTLYKFESKAQRKDGFFNGIILNQSYVIGANRNEYLNNISLVILAIVTLIIGVHIYIRMTRKQY
ncbi:MAG: multiheme c-type cytochrome [Bacteroidales bacterium]